MRRQLLIAAVLLAACHAGLVSELPAKQAPVPEPPSVDALAVAPPRNTAAPLGEPRLEPSTLHSLGVYWVIRGDENKNARIGVEYREAGTARWRPGFPLFRADRAAELPEGNPNSLRVPADAWLFAGSVVLLEPDTAYELKLTLRDPDGGQAEKRLRACTIAEPILRARARRLHVVPGSGGGAGTRRDPLRGLAAAQARARPGDLFLLHAGVYEGTFRIEASGERGKPIVWRGAGDGETILDGRGHSPNRPNRAVRSVHSWRVNAPPLNR